MIHDVLIEWATWSQCGKLILKYSHDIPPRTIDGVVAIGTSMCYFPAVRHSTSSQMPVWTSHLAGDGPAGCCVLDGRLSYSCRLKVKLTGRLWLAHGDLLMPCKWGFPVQTIPHGSSKRNAEVISFRGWRAPSHCCTSSFLRFPCQPPFTSSWLSQGSY